MVFCFSSASAALVMIGNQVGAKEEDTAKAYAAVSRGCPF